MRVIASMLKEITLQKPFVILLIERTEFYSGDNAFTCGIIWHAHSDSSRAICKHCDKKSQGDKSASKHQSEILVKFHTFSQTGQQL